MSDPSRDPPYDDQHDAALDPADVLAGLVVLAAAAVTRVVHRLGPLERLLLQPSFLPEQARPGTWLRAGIRPVAARGRAWRGHLDKRVDTLVPVAVDAALRRVQPTEVIRSHVDLDELVALVDLDAVASRLDIEAVIARVDVDAIAARLDVQAVVERVDLDEAARRLDIEAVLDRVDLTATVLERVDVAALIGGVLDRVDVPALVGDVLDEIDLPEIIRESTGTMASDTVHGVRLQGVTADQAVSRVVDRLLLRRARPATDGAG